LLLVLVVGVVAMFVVGFVRPRKSRVVQSWIWCSSRGNARAARLPAISPLDKSAQAGRKARQKTPLEGG
jgi:hypothetical protein